MLWIEVLPASDEWILHDVEGKSELCREHRDHNHPHWVKWVSTVDGGCQQCDMIWKVHINSLKYLWGGEHIHMTQIHSSYCLLQRSGIVRVSHELQDGECQGNQTSEYVYGVCVLRKRASCGGKHMITKNRWELKTQLVFNHVRHDNQLTVYE